MAGDWEEVIAAGSWTGAGAGTGGGLNKHGGGGRSRCRQFRGGRGRCSASKLYLVDVWGNSDFEFSQEVNAQNGTSHSGLQKTGCKKFALELDRFFNETPRGDRLPHLPL